jgi:hypothetical protein
MKKLDREIRKCEVCGKEFECIVTASKTNCSRECSFKNPNKIIKRRKTCLEKYGVDNVAKADIVKKKGKQTKLERYGDENYGCYGSDSFNKSILKKYGEKNYNNREKAKKTCLEKYGVDNTFKSEEIKDKIKDSLLEKYGVEYISQNENIKEKKKKTCLKNYGVDNPNKSEIIKKQTKQVKLQKYGDENYTNREKSKKTCLDKYGVEYVSQINSVKDKLLTAFYDKILTDGRLNGLKPLFTRNDYTGVNSTKKYKVQCEICDTIFDSNLNYNRVLKCPSCYKWSSIGETEIYNYLTTIIPGINIERKIRKLIYPFEIDLYLPDYKIAIEFNGLYWHSELNGKDSNYHLNKTELCEKKGIQLIHIFEDEWLNNCDNTKNKLKNILDIIDMSIDAELCEIKEINIQKLNNAIELGLFYNNELISNMIFIHKEEEDEYELLQYNTKFKFDDGGMKLFLYFLNEYNPMKVISYVDRRWNTFIKETIYDRLNFKLILSTKPTYWYIINRARECKSNYDISKLKDKLNAFDPELTEWENMQLNGYDRIWDCGNFKYAYIR